MYKTNAKRKSHIIKNHPDCELPEKPTDKVRDYDSIALMLMYIYIYILL